MLFLFVSGEENVFITVLNVKALLADDTDPKFQSYREGQSTTMTYGRYVHTRDGDEYNQEPHQPRSHCCESAAEIINLPSTDNNGFGIFYAQGVEPNKGVNTVPTILLRSDGKNNTVCLNKKETGQTCPFF